jgi:hypothetical protein
MNHDEIIRIAKEAGYVELANDSAMYPPDFFERFAALVAAAEREACIELTDSRCQCAWAIKARGEK